jgi:hypothetical protein
VLRLYHLSHITMINILFEPVWKLARPSRPSRSFHMLTHVFLETLSGHVDCNTLHSFSPSTLSTVQRLLILEYRHQRQAEVKQCPGFPNPFLHNKKKHQTLILIDCNNLAFIFSLNPPHPISCYVLTWKTSLFKSSHSVLYQTPDQHGGELGFEGSGAPNNHACWSRRTHVGSRGFGTQGACYSCGVIG